MLWMIAGQARSDAADDANGTVPAYDRPGLGFGISDLSLGGFVLEKGL